MPYRVNFPPFNEGDQSNCGSLVPPEAETAETEMNLIGSTPSAKIVLKPSDILDLVTPDPYRDRVGKALRSIAALDYPDGTLAWAEIAHPELHRRMVTPEGPIESLWEQCAPMEQFERVLDDWVAANRLGAELYEKHLRSST